MLLEHLLVGAGLLCGVLFSIKAKKLTTAGAFTGGFIGFLVYLGAQLMGIAMLSAFFLLGTLATSWKSNRKTELGIAEKNKGKRKAGQVVANGGVAAIAGLLAWLIPDWAEAFRLMLAASLSAATADTLSSELGNIYGSSYYNIKSFKKDKRGLDGVTSLEGTIIGILGSSFVAFIFFIQFGLSNAILWIIIAGTIGNLSDSYLGATLERKGLIRNNLVNFLNTFIAALTMMCMYTLKR